jgi:hypothetical protein
MSDRKALAPEIAARSKPRFIDTNPAPIDRKMLARVIAAQSKPRFVTIERERPGRVHFTEDELEALRNGLSAEQHRRRLIRKHLKK